ncbi:ASCH domain-containing protein [Streptomyces sp. S9]|nr:ASCH domain-containing protein [Streptomyces sp. S9]
MWPRVDGMRALELGSPGEMRGRLNALVLSGRKRATTGLLAEYTEEGEQLEHVGERLALLDTDGRSVATLEITGVERTTFGEVTWEHAAAEGEGDADLAEWRAGHSRFWAAEGTLVEDGTPLVCLTFRLVPGN